MLITNWKATLKTNVPQQHPGQEALDNADAAVLMAFTEQQDPELVLTLRAAHLSSHAGEVAFPGGKRDQEDFDVVATALRESYEEINLPPALVKVVGPLPGSLSKLGLKVMPIVGIIPADVQLIASEDEIESIFKVPLSYLIQAPPQHTTIKHYRGASYEVPCYRFDGYEIWGLTAYMIWDCCNRVFDTGFNIALPKLVSSSSAPSTN